MTGGAARGFPANRDRLPAGGVEFLGLLARLLRRPKRGERRLPMFWLARDEGAPDLLELVRRAMSRGQRRRIPHAVLDAALSAGDRSRVSAEAESDPVSQRRAGQPPTVSQQGVGGQPGGDVAAMLREAHRQLSLEAFGAKRLRFRHYPLADWLMQQSITSAVELEDRRDTLVQRLRDRRRPRLAPGPALGAAAPGDAVTTAYQSALWLFSRAIPAVAFRAAVSGRIPLFGGRYRWFMRQQYLAPSQSVTFLGFAERLTAGWRDGEQPDQVQKLLIHAFLEDLRHAYRRRPWRPSGWRHTAYPALLIHNAGPGNAGHTLMRLINDIRNETGRNDPLVVVASADRPPPEVREPYPLMDAEEAYEEWADILPERRRLRRPTAWLIVLAVGKVGPNAEPRAGFGGFVATDPPRWPRLVAAVTCAVVLAAGALWVGSRWRPGCIPRPLGGAVAVEMIDGECVGYSDTSAHVFNRSPGQERLRTIQERIFRQNEKAAEVWRDSGRRRPFVTLVYLGTLTGTLTRSDEESYVSEREELEGMATAQYALLQEPAASAGAALLRVVVANAGRQMRHAGRAVTMLADLARDDPTVLGVVGLVESRRSTALALRELNRVGLPALAPNLSADGLSKNSKLYLQLSAPNADQVALVEQYATRSLGVDDAHVYYTTGDSGTLAEDLYVDTLVKGLRERFGDRLSRIEEWSTGQRLIRECGYSGLLFFAGRWSEFDGFLRALRECGPNPPRHLVGDDSVNRYMANQGLRASAPGNVPVTYVSKAALATCAALRAASERRDVGRAAFLTWMQADNLLDPPRCRPNTDAPVGERVSLAYDAAMMMVRAVESQAARLRHANPGQEWEPRSISPVSVHAEVLRQNAESGHSGVSGMIRFATDSGEPVARRISLMRVERVTDVNAAPVEVFRCGVADDETNPGCTAVRPIAR